MNENTFKKYFDFYFHKLKVTIGTLTKWVICAVFSGIIIGFIGACFNLLLSYVTHFRISHDYMLFLLPVAGLIIVAAYKLSGEAANTGTNLVIDAIQSDKNVPARVTPLIIFSTLLTHLCGGSAGREGAALQVGGSLGNLLGKIMKFDEKDCHIAIMCGMSACFSALFGTPIAAAIFSMEVISVGVMYYAALVPCVISALIAQMIDKALNISFSKYPLTDVIPELDVITGLKAILISILFALASILFCMALKKGAAAYSKIFTNQYLRIVVAGFLVITMRFVFNTTDYLGAGADIISRSFITNCAWYVFLLKILFTAVTLGGGFKGGEIVPSLFIGATFGSFLSTIVGLPTGLCAACGMVSVFCGVTNCPITSFLLAVELFDPSCLKYCALCIALTFFLSGYYSLYNSQRIVYSKYKTTFINRNSK